MRAYRIAARYNLAELAKNTLAAVLLAVLIPLWILAAPQIFAPASLTFRLRATGRTLTASTDHVGMIHGCLGVVMLLMAFLTFSAARQAGPFDRRLTTAGYPRTPLLLAKATSLFAAAALVALYTTVWTLAVWSPRHLEFLWLGLFTACLVYGALGLVLALFLPGELEGMVVIFVSSNLDLLPQSPLVNPDPHGFLGPLLPMYGSMQTCLAAGLAPTTPLRPVTASLTWTGALTLIALLAFWIRTRRRQPRDTSRWAPYGGRPTKSREDAARMHLDPDTLTALEKAAEEEKARQRGAARQNKSGRTSRTARDGKSGEASGAGASSA